MQMIEISSFDAAAYRIELGDRRGASAVAQISEPRLLGEWLASLLSLSSCDEYAHVYASHVTLTLEGSQELSVDQIRQLMDTEIENNGVRMVFSGIDIRAESVYRLGDNEPSPQAETNIIFRVV